MFSTIPLFPITFIVTLLFVSICLYMFSVRFFLTIVDGEGGRGRDTENTDTVKIVRVIRRKRRIDFMGNLRE